MHDRVVAWFSLTQFYSGILVYVYCEVFPTMTILDLMVIIILVLMSNDNMMELSLYSWISYPAPKDQHLELWFTANYIIFLHILVLKGYSTIFPYKVMELLNIAMYDHSKQFLKIWAIKDCMYIYWLMRRNMLITPLSYHISIQKSVCPMVGGE